MEKLDNLDLENKFIINSQAFQKLLNEVTDLNENLDNELDLQILFPPEKQRLWKIVLIGDGAVGKTSIRKRFIGQVFDPIYLSTIGADFSTQTLVFGTENIKFQIWDLAGQPKFMNVRKTFYNGSSGALLVYDVTNIQSYKNLENWISELWKHSKPGPIPFILLGNKSDLERDGLKSIPDQYAEFLVKKYEKKTRPRYGFGINFLKTSAKTGDNISLAFKYLAIQIAVKQRYQKLKGD